MKLDEIWINNKIYVFHQSKIGGEVENVGLKKNRPEPRMGENAPSL